MKPRVTEKQWLRAKTPYELHLFWIAKKQYRRWRLLGIACSRRAMMLAPDERFAELADAADRFADGAIDWDKVKSVRRLIVLVRRELGEEFGPNEVKYQTLDALDHATRQKPYDAMNAHIKAAYAYAAACRPKWTTGNRSEERVQVALAHDIFGNPFRPVSFSSEWRTSTVVSIAKSMYHSRDFGPMPLLADALQDAGCEHADILDHCRGAGPHVRGCWVVDLVLGKS